MSMICIKDYNLDINNINIFDNKDSEKFNLRYIFYKYDLNCIKELVIISKNINIDYIYTGNDILSIKTSNTTLVNIFNNIQEKLYKLDSESQSDTKNEKKTVIYLKFINNKTKLILNPSKKSGLEKHTFTNLQDINILTQYFPYIKKTSNKCFYSGNFLIKIKSYFNNVIFQLISGEIKYKKSHIENELKYENVYEEKIILDI